MANTQAQEVYNAFEATFSDKKEIPESLELQWLKMSVGRSVITASSPPFTAMTLSCKS